MNWQTWRVRAVVLSLPSQSEGGEDVLLTGRALIGWRWAEICLPIGADVVVVVFIIMQGVEQRGRGALSPAPHRNDLRALRQAVFQPCVPLFFCSLTWSRCADLWAGSAAARSPPAAHPALSATSSWRAPVGQSPPLLRPSDVSRPSGADSATWKSTTEVIKGQRHKPSTSSWTSKGRITTYLILLVQQGVMLFFTLHHHLFYLSLQSTVSQLQVRTFPSTRRKHGILHQSSYQPWLWIYEQTLHNSAGAQTSFLHSRSGS